jgi:hypothetical protein
MYLYMWSGWLDGGDLVADLYNHVSHIHTHMHTQGRTISPYTPTHPTCTHIVPPHAYYYNIYTHPRIPTCTHRVTLREQDINLLRTELHPNVTLTTGPDIAPGTQACRFVCVCMCVCVCVCVCVRVYCIFIYYVNAYIVYIIYICVCWSVYQIRRHVCVLGLVAGRWLDLLANRSRSIDRSIDQQLIKIRPNNPQHSGAPTHPPPARGVPGKKNRNDTQSHLLFVYPPTYQT